VRNVWENEPKKTHFRFYLTLCPDTVSGCPDTRIEDDLLPKLSGSMFGHVCPN
jgi:hypothetical protein